MKRARIWEGIHAMRVGIDGVGFEWPYCCVFHELS